MKTKENLEKAVDDELPENSSKKKSSTFSRNFEKLAAKATKATGSSTVFSIAVLFIVAWALTGPIFKFSDTWQLVINTSTTIITFLMVFIIQHTQNKDSLAMQLKLNELIAANEKASNRLIVVEDLSQEELETLKNFYVKLSELAKRETDLHSSHSVEEATGVHKFKMSRRKSASAPEKK